MKLEDQVVSLELAQKMKELGFEQESLFYWRHSSMRGWRIISTMTDLIARNLVEESLCSAYTVAELELQQDYLVSRVETAGWFLLKYDGKYSFSMLTGFALPIHTSEADARAKAIIHLKENNLL